MTDGLKIAKNLTLPIDAVTQAFAVLARRGAGKTYTASVMAEEMLEHNVPIVWLDPLGVAWGLRTSYPVVIFGGDHADVPLDSKSGVKIADIVVKERFPVILDVSEFGENEMRQFVYDFVNRFYRKNRKPVHVFLDEADEFAPQTGAGGGPTGKCISAIQNIVRRGRARGIGITMITQRSAVINKSILTQTEGLFAMQTTHPKDLKPIEDWFSYHLDSKDRQREIMNTLPKLKQGEAYFYSPGWTQEFKRIKVRKRRTQDSSFTPKVGEAQHKPKAFKPVDIDALRESMGASDQGNKSDGRTFGKRETVAVVKLAQAEKRIHSLQVDYNQVLTQLKQAQQVITYLKKTLGGIVNQANIALEKEVSPPKVQISVTEKSARKVKKATAPKSVDVSDYLELPKAQRRILRALYWLRTEEVTPAKVGFYSDYKASSGNFNNALSGLRSAGYVSGWNITEEGETIIPNDVVLQDKPTGSELREWLRPKLQKAPNQILDVLMQHYPNRVRVEQVAIESGYSYGSGSFNNALSRLRSLQIASGGERDGGVIVSEVFFE